MVTIVSLVHNTVGKMMVGQKSKTAIIGVVRYPKSYSGTLNNLYFSNIQVISSLE